MFHLKNEKQKSTAAIITYTPIKNIYNQMKTVQLKLLYQMQVMHQFLMMVVFL